MLAENRMKLKEQGLVLPDEKEGEEETMINENEKNNQADLKMPMPKDFKINFEELGDYVATLGVSDVPIPEAEMSIQIKEEVVETPIQKKEEEEKKEVTTIPTITPPFVPPVLKELSEEELKKIYKEQVEAEKKEVTKLIKQKAEEANTKIYQLVKMINKKYNGKYEDNGNFTKKVNKGNMQYWEVNRIAELLGYEIKWIKKSENAIE